MKPSLRAEPGPSVPGQPLFFTFSWLSHCLRPGLLDLAWKHLTPRTLPRWLLLQKLMEPSLARGPSLYMEGKKWSGLHGSKGHLSLLLPLEPEAEAHSPSLFLSQTLWPLHPR